MPGLEGIMPRGTATKEEKVSQKGRECGQERESLEEDSEAPFIRGRIQGLEGAMTGRYISLLECITNYHNLGEVSKNPGS